MDRSAFVSILLLLVPGPGAWAQSVVVNEIDYDQAGTDAGEFVEILNTGPGVADLSSVELILINGSGGAIYRTFSLAAAGTLGAGEYLVVCADAANVVSCDLEVTPNTNLIQNGAPDAVALRTTSLVILDTVSYEGDVLGFVEGSGVAGDDSSDFVGISRAPDGSDTDDNSTDFAKVCITPGAANTTLAANCGPPDPGPETSETSEVVDVSRVFEIFEIQSSGASSPFEGQIVTTRGNVVTAVGPDGFAMQTPMARTDGDIDTSDGIFVFTEAAPGVSVGDLVDVSGTIVEFYGFTEFSDSPTVALVGTGTLPPAVAFDVGVPSPDPTSPSCGIEYECYEGMLVEVVDGSVASGNQRFNPDPRAEVYVTASSRPFRETGIAHPGRAGLPVWDANPEIFELDPDRLGLPNRTLAGGSTFSAVGVLGFEFGGYELWPSSLSVTPAALPVAVRDAEPGEKTVASLNLFRLFDDVDDPSSTNTQGTGTRNDTVVSAVEYRRRRDKLSAYIRDVLGSPDILAVQEAEKIEVLEDLVAQIATDDPGVVYSAFLEEGNDFGTIDVGFLVRDTVDIASVTQLGAGEILDFDGSLLHDRPPLLLEASWPSDGSVDCEDGTQLALHVLVVHQRSLGGIDSASDGPRVRAKRLAQAQSVAAMVQTIQDSDPDARLVVLGDFNAFELTDGYVDVLGQIAGDVDPGDNLLSGPDLVDPTLENLVAGLDPEDRYSYLFRGSAQTLDHALVSETLQGMVRGLAFGRGNADAAVDLVNDGSTALRSSDHDGLVLYIKPPLRACAA